jgi:alpha-D-ribose 1-methylphosphonate 5-triphosphate synthase subunit PhnH
VQVRGPGVDGAAHFFTKGLHPVFLGTLKEKNQEFPQGVDVMLTCGARVVSLPRSSQLEWR